MAEAREFRFWSSDFSSDGIIDGNGLNAPVTGEFPLEVGEVAQVFTRAMVYQGSDGAGGGIFREEFDGSQMYVSDDTRLEAGSPVPTPVDEPLPLDPNEPDQPDGIIGTDGDDILIGTPEDDRIEGLAGNDAISGEAGNDLLIGDLDVYNSSKGVGGDDVILGGEGNDSIFGDSSQTLSATMQGGDDTLFGNVGSDTLNGDALVLRDSAVGGDDILVSGEGEAGTESTLIGDGDLFDDATGGGDLLVGGAGVEIMVGDGVQLFGNAQGGDDTLFVS